MPLSQTGPPAGQSAMNDRALDTFTSALEQAAAETLEECRADSAAALSTFAQAVDTLRDSLGKSRSQLADSFTLVREKESKNITATAERLQTEIDAQRAWLLKKVRPRFEQQLKSLALDGKPVLGLLEKIAERARQAVEALPDEPEPSETASKSPEKTLLQRLNRRLRGLSGIDEEPPLSPRNRARLTLPSTETLQQTPLVTEYVDLVAHLESKAADLWSSLRFHFQVAGEELDRLKIEPASEKVADFDAIISEAEHLALGVLDLASEEFTRQILPLQEFWDGLCDRLRQHGAGVHQSLHEALVGRESEKNGAWLVLNRTVQRQRDTFRQWIVSHEGDPASILSISKVVLASLQDVIHKEPGPQENLPGLTDLPSTSEILKRAETFPHLYRRLFTLGPLKTREFLIARDKELKTMGEVFKRWEEGKDCSLAVIGPEGSGKTSLTNCFASEYGARGNLLRFEIGRRLRSEQEVVELFRQWFAIESSTDSLNTLVQELLALPRSMVLVEGGHNLTLRVVGGSRAAEVFFYLIMATRRHFLWLITFRRIPWTRMDYQFGISRYFTHRISILFTSPREVRQALLLRQRISNYPLVFLDDLTNGAENSELEEQKRREEQFFRELFAASGGNLDAVLYYWLLSLDYDPEHKIFQARHLGKIDFSFLRGLERDQLFTLAEVLGHGGLSANEHSEIFTCDLLRSRLQLDYLSSLRLLLTDSLDDGERSDHYRLNPGYYHPITTTLESMHILY